MPRVAKQTLAALAGDMSDDELGYTQFAKDAPEMPTPDSAAEGKAAVTKRCAGRPKKNAAASVPAKKVEAKSEDAQTIRRGKRGALEDLTNMKDAKNEGPAKKRVKANAKTVSTKTKGKKKQDVEEEQDVSVQEEEPVAAAEEPVEEEESMDIEASIEEVQPQQVLPNRRVIQPTPRSQSQTRPIARGNSRAMSTERGVGDAALRRRLGDMTSKYESMELKYNQLKETASTDAQSNFDKLKAATERQAKTQDNLIASLRKQIASQKDLANEARTLRSQLATSQTETDRLKTEKSSSSDEIKTLKEANTKSHNEIKALQAKLAASRAHSEPAQSSKGAAGKNATVVNNPSNALASLKEDLYCDVTGLLIHNVKKTDRRTVYDCSQTGRNGTLRFQFTIEELDRSTMTPGASVFDDAQVTYTPLIDERNDQQLYDILQDFLLEEIEFPRSSLQKLYTSIRDGMQKPVVIQEEDDSTMSE